MKFKKDGKVYEGTIEMMNAHCGSAVCSDCDILNRCRKNESCSDYAYANPVEVAHYLGFEAIENDGEPSIGEIIEKSVQNLAHWHKENIEREEAKRRSKDVKRDIREVVEKDGEDVKHKLTRADILHAAEKCVCGQRETDYGTPEDNFKAIAELWSVYLDRISVGKYGNMIVDEKDVAVMMALLKIARIAAGGGKADSWIDLAGYAACGAECEGVTE